MKTLFKNCKILLRENGTYRTLNHAYLGIDGALIDYIGTEIPQKSYETVKDYTDKLLMPGLYNCHTHSPMVLFRGVGSDTPLHTWLNDYIFPLEKALTDEQVSAASYLAIAEMIAGGTVSFTDMYFYPEATAQAVANSGMKANLTKPIQFPAQNPDILSQSQAFIQQYGGTANERILTDFSIHSLYTVDMESARAYTALCNDCHGRMHIHLAETNKEYEECMQRYSMSPAQWFESIGALNERVTAAHCVVLSESDIELLAARGVHAVHCPTSNLKLGSGFAPVPALVQQGVDVALGTDGAASNNNLNMLEEMHLAAILHKGRLQDTTVMPADAVLDMATVNGAKAQGRANCGALKVGWKADIIALDLDKPHMVSAYDAKSLIPYSAQADDVYMTMADGKMLYENKQFLTIDYEKIRSDFEALFS